jgi:hypothetical protein
MMTYEESEIDKEIENNQCLICGISIDPKASIFEQRLIKDEDFCGKCFAEIMNDSDGETIVLPNLVILE